MNNEKVSKFIFKKADTRYFTDVYYYDNDMLAIMMKAVFNINKERDHHISYDGFHWTFDLDDEINFHTNDYPSETHALYALFTELCERMYE
jgi:hypothetical protein